MELIATAEATIQELKGISSEQKQLLRQQVATAVSSNPPRANLPKNERNALAALQRDENITIVPADKGKCLVVMDAPEYR